MPRRPQITMTPLQVLIIFPLFPRKSKYLAVKPLLIFTWLASYFKVLLTEVSSHDEQTYFLAESHGEEEGIQLFFYNKNSIL